MEVLGFYIPTWLLLLLTTLLLFYIWATWRNGELKALGIPHPPPSFLIGNLAMVFKKPGMFEFDIELRKKYGDVWGFYEGRVPSIVVADVDIIKEIFVKDFGNFVNRRKMVLRGIFKYGLFDAVDNHWKHLRRLSSPAFSSGKLKYMSRQINQIALQLKESLQKKADAGESFEVKQVFSAFTMDVIAATAFGLQIDSQKDENNPFIVNGKKFFDLALNPLLIATFFFPDLLAPLDRLGVSVGNKQVGDFFKGILKQTLEERRQGNQPNDHVDFLKLMMEADGLLENADEEVMQELKEGNLTAELGRQEKGLTENEIIAQSLLFLLAGFETTAATMTFVLYHLAVHQEIQDKVLKEVQEVWGDKEEMKYEDLNKLKYMDMCIDETMRIFPPATRLDRRASTEVTIKNIRIPKDYVVAVPVRALHYDPEVWPEPHKFDPERFTPEAKAARNPYYYLPFGVGPRNCVGMRLAQMELKVALATAIKHFHFKVSSKCPDPLELENTFILRVKGGVWLDAEVR